jgi:hypothetical protein
MIRGWSSTAATWLARAGEIAPMLCGELSWYEVDKSRCACERERSRNVRICLS